jgi:glyoxylase-like metal-dependent hydrolase (beta-lactamase superfamily II)
MLCLLLVPLAVCAQEFNTPYGEVGVPFDVRQVPDSNVYYVIGQSGVPSGANEGFTSNAGFVVTSKGVVVYDALGTPALGYLLLEAIRKVTDKPVTHVIAGHYHADHIYGLQAFREHTSAKVIAQLNSSVYIDGPAAPRRLKQRREALFPWVNEKTYVVKPDIVFTERHPLDMGDTHLEIIHVGPAHSPDDNILVVREAGVVFSGDIIYGGRLPFLGSEEVSTKNWLRGLSYLDTLDPAPRFIIPGHGTASADARAAIDFTRNYIEYLRTEMGKAVSELRSFDQAYADTDWSRYREVPTFKQANRQNAYHVYLEMEAEAF